MKYKTLGIVILIGVLIGVGIYFLFIKDGNQVDTIQVKVSSEEELIQKIENKDSFILVVGESMCLSCKDYKNTTLKEYVKENGHEDLVLIYIDTSFSTMTFNDFKESYGIEYGMSPTTYYFKNGQYNNSKKEDIISLEALKSFIEKNEASE